MADLSDFSIDELLSEISKRTKQAKIKECKEPPNYKEFKIESNSEGVPIIPYCPVCNKPLPNRHDPVIGILGLGNKLEYEFVCECGYKYKYD